MNKRISILGHFGFGLSKLNGQTIKTRIFHKELSNHVSLENVDAYDTNGGILFLLKLPLVAWRMLSTSSHVIILPAHNGIRVIPLVMLLLNTIFRRRIHYVVIGGWLPSMLSTHAALRAIIGKLDSVHVETQSMQERMEELGLTNVSVMPNFKSLPILKEGDLPSFTSFPLPLCTFSRVVQAKGISDAVDAVNMCNERLGFTAYTLNIYGPVDDKPWFDELSKSFTENIHYRGWVDYNDTVPFISKHFALLFPTWYEGECFAGTILDAFAAGTPVFASDWHDNAKILQDGVTGRIYPIKSPEAICNILMEYATAPEKARPLRINCLDRAHYYDPKNIVKEFAEQYLR